MPRTKQCLTLIEGNNTHQRICANIILHHHHTSRMWRQYWLKMKYRRIHVDAPKPYRLRNIPYLGQHDTSSNTYRRTHYKTLGTVRSTTILTRRSEMILFGQYALKEGFTFILRYQCRNGYPYCSIYTYCCPSFVTYREGNMISVVIVEDMLAGQHVLTSPRRTVSRDQEGSDSLHCMVMFNSSDSRVLDMY